MRKLWNRLGLWQRRLAIVAGIVGLLGLLGGNVLVGFRAVAAADRMGQHVTVDENNQRTTDARLSVLETRQIQIADMRGDIQRIRDDVTYLRGKIDAMEARADAGKPK